MELPELPQDSEEQRVEEEEDEVPGHILGADGEELRMNPENCSRNAGRADIIPYHPSFAEKS